MNVVLIDKINKKNIIQLMAFLAGLFIIPSVGLTQLTGSYTIGSGGNYATFGAAVAALNSQGVSGAVTFNVISGTYNEQIEINSLAGSSATNTITFQAQSGTATDVTLTFSPTSSANYIVRLNGADYVTFQNITLTAIGPSYGRIFVYGENADNNRIQNCILNGVVTNSPNNNLAIVFCDPTTTTSDNLIINNNILNNGGHGILIEGVNTTTLASGTQILNNTFNSVRRGIELNYHVAPVITGNEITASGDRGIELSYCDGALAITQNRISAASSYTLYMYACDGGVPPAGTPGLIANNFITNFGNSGRGIYSYSNTYQNFYYNSVNVPGNTDSRAFEDYASGGNVNLVNNIFAAPAGGYAYYISTPSAISTSDYNDHYTTGTNLAYWGNNNHTSLAALQSASGKDTHSISAIPGFISNTNLHVRGIAPDSSATPLAEVTEDIDGAPRDVAYPDIGADEYLFGFNYHVPVISSVPDTSANINELYQYQIVATDDDGDTLTYNLITAPAFLTINATSGLVQGTPNSSQLGFHPVTVAADDGRGGVTTQDYILHVRISTSIDPFTNQIPNEFMMFQNYPNPFNPITQIRYAVPQSAHVTIEVYNSLGQKVAELVNLIKPAGYHLAEFEASRYASGIYFYRINAGNYQKVMKMMLMK